MKISSLNINLYNRNKLTQSSDMKIANNHISSPLNNDVFIKQQNSQVAFCGLFSGLFKFSETEKTAKFADNASKEMSQRISRYHDDPNIVIMSYLTKTPYTKENAHEFTKYLYSHDIDINKKYKNARDDYDLWHKSIGEGMDTAGQWGSHGLDDAQKYKTHIMLKTWKHYPMSKSLGYYVSILNLCPQDISNLKNWIVWAQKSRNGVRQEPIWFDSYGVNFYQNAIKKKNIPLLKFLIEDLKLKPYDMSAHEYDERYHEISTAGEVILNGRSNKDAEISQLFDDEHLYNMLVNIEEREKKSPSSSSFNSLAAHLANIAPKDKGIAILLKALIDKEEGLYNKNNYLSEAIQRLCSSRFDFQREEKEMGIKIASELPMSPIERIMPERQLNRTLGNCTDIYRASFSPINSLRAQNIIERNVSDGQFTIESLKKCLKDKIMTPEILVQQGSSTSIIEEISKIKVDDENRAGMKELVQEIRDMHYLKFSGDLLSEVGYNAAINNNAELLQLLKDNHVNLNKAVQIFKNDTDISENIRTILSDIKIQSNTVVDYAKYDSIEAFNAFARTGLNDIDINSRSMNGTTLLLEAAKTGNVDIIRKLKTMPDVDWDITDSFGKNVLMHTLDFALKDAEKTKEIIEILKSLPDGKFDINHINYCANDICPYPHTAVQYRLRHSLSEDILKEIISFKDFKVNTHAKNSLPTAYIPFFNNKPEQFKFLIRNSDIDTRATYRDKTLRENLFSNTLFPYIGNVNEAAPFERLLDNKANSIFINKLKRIYDKEGSLTIEQINDFINYGQIENIQSEPLNSIGERIPHFVAEIFPDSSNPDEVLELTKLFEKFKQKNINIDILDDIGRSPLRKSIEADNAIVAKLFKDYGSNPTDIEEIKSLIKESDNPQIKNIYK